VPGVFRITYQEIAETAPLEKTLEKSEDEKLTLEGGLMDLVEDQAIKLLENGEGLGLWMEENYAAMMQ
jgi:hypothetical protein